MKKTIITKTVCMVVCCLASIVHGQSWGLSGNNISTGNYLGTNNVQNLVFRTSSTEKMVLTAGGTLGIGTATPTSDKKLHVAGRTLIRSSEQWDLVDIVNDATGVGNTHDAVWIAYSQYQSNNPGLLTVTSPNTAGGLATYRFTVRANGKVGIGVNPNSFTTCADCNDYLLFVKNGIKAEKVKVEIASENGWADFVFNDNYNLMPLNELDTFIKENKHLPEIPSESEVIEQGGIELKEFSVKLLQKIEELTLYMIQQDQTIQKLKQQVADLESSNKK